MPAPLRKSSVAHEPAKRQRSVPQSFWEMLGKRSGYRKFLLHARQLPEVEP